MAFLDLRSLFAIFFACSFSIFILSTSFVQPWLAACIILHQVLGLIDLFSQPRISHTFSYFISHLFALGPLLIHFFPCFIQILGTTPEIQFLLESSPILLLNLFIKLLTPQTHEPHEPAIDNLSLPLALLSPILFLTHLNHNIHLHPAAHLGTETWQAINQRVPLLGTCIWSPFSSLFQKKKKSKTRYRIYQCGDRVVKVKRDDDDAHRQDESKNEIEKEKEKEGGEEKKSGKTKKARRRKKKNRTEEDDRRGMEKDKREGSWFGGLGLRFERGFVRSKRNLVEGSMT
ncbi:hypothetical protein ACMFMG_006877 [Clarireedia jacksonii]